MANKYKRKYKKLKKTYDFLDSYVQDMLNDNDRYINDIRYLEAFIK